MTSKLGPSLEMQAAITATLGADAAVKALLGATPRINPPQSTTWPGSYIEIGGGQEIPDLAECIDGTEVYFDIHIWSRVDRSFADAKKIAATIWDCLTNANLTLSENRLLLIERQNQQHMRDSDGVTLHVVLTLRALTEPAA